MNIFRAAVWMMGFHRGPRMKIVGVRSDGAYLVDIGDEMGVIVSAERVAYPPQLIGTILAMCPYWDDPPRLLWTKAAAIMEEARRSVENNSKGAARLGDQTR